MSERYFTIGAPMTDLPRPTTGTNYTRIESSLLASSGSSSGGGGGGGGGSVVRFHDCSLNDGMTNSRDAKDPVLEPKVKVLLL